MKKDETWNAFDQARSADEFYDEFVPELYVKPQVNKEIVENFRVIRKLIEYSYFEYRFYDVATLESLLTLEMALKIRFSEINLENWPKKKSLSHLMDWFQKHNYFEVYNGEFLRHIRAIRNLMAHPLQHSFSGPHGR